MSFIEDHSKLASLIIDKYIHKDSDICKALYDLIVTPSGGEKNFEALRQDLIEDLCYVISRSKVIPGNIDYPQFCYAFYGVPVFMFDDKLITN